MTNTSIRIRKIRGDDSLSGSSSLAMSFQEVCRTQPLPSTMTQTGDREKAVVVEPDARIKPLIELKLGWSRPV
jgi:hypothetical protein